MKRGEKNSDAGRGGEKVAQAIASGLLKMQKGFACFMGVRTAGLSKRAIQGWLYVFCLGFGGLSLYALSGLFRVNAVPLVTLKPAQVVVPRYFSQPGVKDIPMITKTDIDKIGLFKKGLDSLSSSPFGKRIYDSILLARPQLLDSLHLIESYYQSQLK